MMGDRHIDMPVPLELNMPSGQHVQWTEDMDAQVTKYMREGMSINKIADEMDLSVSSVQTRVQRLGLVYKKKAPPWSEEQIATLEQMYADGKSDKEIAKVLDRTPMAVASRRIRMKLKRRTADAEEPPEAKSIKRRPKAEMDLRSEAPKMQAMPEILPARTCQWIEGDVPSEYLFCGKPSVIGHSWCEEHLHRVYTKVPERTGKPWKAWQPY